MGGVTEARAGQSIPGSLVDKEQPPSVSPIPAPHRTLLPVEQAGAPGEGLGPERGEAARGARAEGGGSAVWAPPARRGSPALGPGWSQAFSSSVDSWHLSNGP